jgi:phosphoglycolate phosphatase
MRLEGWGGATLVPRPHASRRIVLVEADELVPRCDAPQHEAERGRDRISTMKYRLVVFDIDGTLSDSLPWFRSIVNSVAAKYRFRAIGDDEIEMLRGKGSREIISFLQVPAWKLPLIARDMRKLKARSLDQIPLFPGVEPMLRRLSARGIVNAIVSSDSEANARRALGSCAGSISHFACGASLFGKAAKLRKVLARTGIPASQALAIGDEVRDGEAAHAVGMDFGAVTWGYAKVEALQRLRPAFVFGSIEEIAATVS